MSESSGGLPPLKITNVKAICTAPDGIRLVVVKVETSEPGLYGLGCATFTQRPLAVVTAIEEYLKPFLIGRDPHDIEDICQAALRQLLLAQRPGAEQRALRRRQALWDIKGKRAGMPVYQLLGGKCRKAAPRLRPRLRRRRPRRSRTSARRCMEQGFRHIRCQVAVPGYSTYGVQVGPTRRQARTPARPDAPSRRGRRRGSPPPTAGSCPKLFEHLRARSATRSSCCTTSTSASRRSMAIQLAKELEPYQLFFLEDPFAPEDNDYFPLLRQQTRDPDRDGRAVRQPGRVRAADPDRLIDFIRVHISDIGGLTPARKLAAFCEFFGVRTAWHGPGDVSPVGHAANLHLDLACPNFGIQEAHLFGERTPRGLPRHARDPRRLLWANDQPGLGIDIDEALAAKYPFPEHPLNGAWPPVRRRDGTVIRP